MNLHFEPANVDRPAPNTYGQQRMKMGISRFWGVGMLRPTWASSSCCGPYERKGTIMRHRTFTRRPAWIAGLGSLFVMTGTSLAQTTYFVSTQGNDGNDGLSQNSAFATIQAAADIVGPSDTVHVMPGTYAGFMVDSKSGAASARIVFHADPGVVIQGEGAQTCQRHETVCLWESNYLTVEGFEIVGRDCGYGQCDVLSVRADGGQQHATQGAIIRNNYLHGGQSRGLYITFPVECIIENNEISDSGIGIYFANGAPASYGNENSRIAANHIHDNSSLAIHVNADASSPGDGIIRGLTINRNLVAHNAGQAIHFDGVCDSTVVNNVVLDNRRGIILSRVDGAIPPENDVVMNNTVIQASGSQVCLRIGGGAHDIAVFNNVFIHADSMVMDLEGNGGSLTSDYNAVSNLSQVQGATGDDGNTIEVTLTTAGFNDSSHDDLSLTQSSPLVNAGVDQIAGYTAPGDDIAGAARPAEGRYDIGAYEYGSAALVILTNALPGVVVSDNYHYALTAAGGKTPYTWSVTSGDLPAGITLDASTGILSGITRLIGISTFTVQVQDSTDPIATAHKEFIIQVVASYADGGPNPHADAGNHTQDAGTTQPDAATHGSHSNGCGCASSAPTKHFPLWPLLLLPLFFLKRRHS